MSSVANFMRLYEEPHFSGTVPNLSNSKRTHYDSRDVENGWIALLIKRFKSSIEPIMCGMVFCNVPNLRRHLREFHPGTVLNRGRVNLSTEETIAGQNAIKKWVLSGGWRDADYVNEPGRIIENGLIDIYATASERIAASDPDFAEKFGNSGPRPGQGSSPATQQRLMIDNISLHRAQRLRHFQEHKMAMLRQIDLAEAEAPYDQDTVLQVQGGSL